MRSMAKAQEFQPQMAAIKEKHKGNQQKILEETRKLQKEMGVNPAAGCLPMLVQMPVFLGLFHVLRSFNRTGTGTGQLGLSIAVNRNTPNYFFKPEDVQSFLDARFFGVPLSAYISMPKNMYDAFQPVNFTRMNIIIVTIPLIVLIALATHLNGRHSVSRTKRRQAEGLVKKPTSGQMQMQSEMMNKMMVWFFPFTILITGAFWHIGLLFYMAANNIWTYGQQRILFKKLDEEEAASIAAKKAAKRATAPRPGVKPVNPKKGGRTKAFDTTTQPEVNIETAPPNPDENTGMFGGLKSAWRQMMHDAEVKAADKAQADKTPATQGDITPKDSAPVSRTQTNTGMSKPQPGAKPVNNKKRRKKKK